jgi:hypothetical protein
MLSLPPGQKRDTAFQKQCRLLCIVKIACSISNAVNEINKCRGNHNARTMETHNNYVKHLPIICKKPADIPLFICDIQKSKKKAVSNVRR